MAVLKRLAMHATGAARVHPPRTRWLHLGTLSAGLLWGLRSLKERFQIFVSQVLAGAQVQCWAQGVDYRRHVWGSFSS